MRIILLLLLLLTTTIISTAQSVFQGNVSVGEPYEIVDAPFKHYASNEDFILSIKIADKTITIQQYSLANKKMTTQKVEVLKGKKEVFEGFKEVGSNYYFFSSIYANNSYALIARKLNIEKAVLEEAVELITIGKKSLDCVEWYINRKSTAARQKYSNSMY